MQTDQAFPKHVHSFRQQLHYLPHIFSLMLGVLVLTAATPSRADPPGARPRIGLALSGGAALGIAHIGVLEWFDQHHIPIDYLAGTSMGGLVGGCYCTGMTTDEMRALLKGIDWNDALSGGPAYNDLSLRRKEDLEAVPSRLELGLRHGVALPEGLSPAAPIGLLLSRVSLSYSGIADFDDLPTPFRCVATDLDNGEAVTFKDGSLATALRATMAIPALFTPVERDGHLYTDGGSLENIPTEAVKAMGADIIIAVDLSGNFLDAKHPASLVDILGRTADVTTYANERRSLQLADIVLTPAFGPLNGGDFMRVDDLADRGYQAADAKSKILERFALDDADWQAYVAQRDARRRNTVAPPEFAEVAGVSGKTATALQSRLQPLMGKPFNVNGLQKTLTDLTAAGRYESFQYQETEHQGTPGLLVYADQKKYGPPFLRLGLDILGADTDNIRTNLTARLYALDVGAPGAEVRADLRLGSDQDAALEYYRPLDSRLRWFVAPRVFTNNTSISYYDQNARLAVYDDRNAGAELDIGYNPSRSSEVRLGYQRSRERTSITTGSPLLPSVSGDAGEARLQFTSNSLDSPILPSRGQRIHLETDQYFQSPGSSRSFPLAQATVSSFFPVRNGDTSFFLLGAGTTFGHQAGPLEQFALGGPLLLGAYQPGEFRGNQYVLVTPGYLHRLAQLPSILGGRVMLGGWYEAGGAFDSQFGSTHVLSDLSVGLIADTLLGPIAFSYSYGEAGRTKFSFAIGSFF